MKRGASEEPVGVQAVQRGSTKEAIYDAALNAFAEKGYFGASLRDIAQRVGVEVASLYNHISSKEGLLFEMIMQTSVELLDELIAARDSVEGNELDVLRAVMRRHLVFSASHLRNNFVGTVELRALTPEHLREAVAIRTQVEAIYKELVCACIAAGRLPVDTHVTAAAYQLIALSMSLTDWFRPDGELNAEQVADLTLEMLEHGLMIRKDLPAD